jgi:nicotinamide riboside kinase
VVIPFRIALTGTHSTGKTTMLKRLEMELRARGVRVARTGGSIAQLAADRGFPKMRAQTATTTQWIIATGIAAEMEAALDAEVVLVDRSVIDPVAYWLAALQHRGESPAAGDVEHLMQVAQVHARGYSLILSTVLDHDVPLGEHRHRDLGYRALVADKVAELLPQFDVPVLQVDNSDDSREAAIQAALADVTQMSAA